MSAVDPREFDALRRLANALGQVMRAVLSESGLGLPSKREERCRLLDEALAAVEARGEGKDAAPSPEGTRTDGPHPVTNTAPGSVPLAERRAYMAHPDTPCDHEWVSWSDNFVTHTTCRKCGVAEGPAPSVEPLSAVLARVEDALVLAYEPRISIIEDRDRLRIIAVARDVQVLHGPDSGEGDLLLRRHEAKARIEAAVRGGS